MTAVYEKKGNCLTGSLEEIHKDGAYRLTVTAQDEAGNKSVDGCFLLSTVPAPVFPRGRI